MCAYVCSAAVSSNDDPRCQHVKSVICKSEVRGSILSGAWGVFLYQRARACHILIQYYITPCSFVVFLDSNISFGRPGVEFYGQHSVESGENAVTKIVAVPNEVRFDALIMIVFTLNKITNFQNRFLIA